ncbi:VTT domain-containing protein [Hypericibacter sp.]|uniref:bifunctional DedA family/phosphatase PAP2 family protein n=1 Tax=Hypericibacter sp. TaxID=2705401 RepID=UPI003D6C98F8
MLDYLRGFLDFFAANPALAYGLGFFAAMAEALPVIGAVIPGSTLIIATGALVATDSIRLGPLSGWVILGAVIGDTIAYNVGRYYGRSIVTRWPFSRHPRLVEEAERFFARHGGKSVLFGRFLPATRAFVPLFAGILRLSPARFYPAVILSAAMWAFAHILPGVAVGASLTLAGAVAGRLLIFIALLAAVLFLALWLARLTLRIFIPWIGRLAARADAWAVTGDRWPQRLMRSLLEPGERELRGLIVAVALLVATLWLFFAILEGVVGGEPLVRADSAIFGLLQNLRSPWADGLMVAVTELGDPVVVIGITLAVLIWLLLQRAWRTALYWMAAVTLSSFFNTGLKMMLYRPRPAPDLYSGWGAFSFPSGHATVNIVMWGFLAFLATREMKPLGRRIFIGFTVAFVSLIAVSRLYLGAHWFSDVSAGLAFGAAWLTLLGTVYLHHRPERIHSKGLAVAAVAALVGIGAFHIHSNHDRDLAFYGVRQQTQAMSLEAWRQGGWNTLPERRVDLKGHYEEPFTVAWVGPPRAIAMKLEEAGWREPVRWSLSSLLAWLLPNPGPEALPVLPRLDDGRSPVLIRLLPRPDGSRLVLRLWPTELAIHDETGASQPVMVGMVAAQAPRRLLKLITLNRMQGSFDAARDVLAQTLQSGRLVAHVGAATNAGWDGKMLLLETPGP